MDGGTVPDQKYKNMSQTTLKKLLTANTVDLLTKIKKANPPFAFEPKKEVVLFGAGILGIEFLGVCRSSGLTIRAICDNDKTKKGKKILGVKIISVNELIKYPKDATIIITVMHDFIVKEQLDRLGYKNIFSHTYFATVYPKKFNYFNWQSSLMVFKNELKEIMKLYTLLEDGKSKKILEGLIKYRLTLDHNKLIGIVDKMENEYFDPSIIKLIKDEVFIDGGGFDGDTVKKFIQSSHGNFKEIHTFEPDKRSQNKIRIFLRNKNDTRIKLHDFGLSNKKQAAFFTNEGTAGSKLSNYSKYKIKLITLDDYLYNRKPTFIKFDIEGSETEAILGMKKIMRDFKPKLAICVYHKPSDLWKIPLLIKKINPRYKIFIRHYTQTQHDTVCYAI